MLRDVISSRDLQQPQPAPHFPAAGAMPRDQGSLPQLRDAVPAFPCAGSTRSNILRELGRDLLRRQATQISKILMFLLFLASYQLQSAGHPSPKPSVEFLGGHHQLVTGTSGLCCCLH